MSVVEMQEATVMVGEEEVVVSVEKGAGIIWGVLVTFLVQFYTPFLACVRDNGTLVFSLDVRVHVLVSACSSSQPGVPKE